MAEAATNALAKPFVILKDVQDDKRTRRLR